MEKKVYLASPFFYGTEKEDMEKVLKVLRNSRYIVFAPYEFIIPDGWEMSNLDWAKKIYEKDIKEIKNADIVVAINHGQYSDSGTAYEIGFASALNKPIYLICFEGKIDSLMTNNAATGIINFNYFKENTKIKLEDFNGNIIENEQK